MSRKTITIPEPVYDDLDDASTDDESFGDTIERLIEAVPAEESEGRNDELAPNTLTEEHIPDIAAAASTQTVGELENLLRGR